MKPVIIISIAVAIILSIVFVLGIDTKAINFVKEKTSAPEIPEPTTRGRSLNGATAEEVQNLKIEIKYIKDRLAEAENKLKDIEGTAVTTDSIEKIIKAISPILIPVITFYLNEQHKKRKTKRRDK